MTFDVAYEAASQLAGSFYNSFQASKALANQLKTGKEYPDFLGIMAVGIPVLVEREDAYWLYLHQGVAPNNEQLRYHFDPKKPEETKMIELYGPYRPRIYRISEINPTHAVVQMFKIRDEIRFAAAAFFPELLKQLTIDDLIEMEGGFVDLIYNPETGSFKGGTRGMTCKNNYGGAEYATTEVKLEPGMLCSLDIGYKGNWTYVWGSQLGPYRFERLITYEVRQLKNKTVTPPCSMPATTSV
jgi:hypothetical protein